jgi:type I restriction enzyme S subunit
VHPDLFKNIPSDWSTMSLKNACEFTVKPRALDVSDFPDVAFVPMDLIPTGRLAFSDFTLKPPASITSGTYFEEGDLLVSKITPCFENGKQGIARSIPNGFGFATTEVIPIKERPGISHLPFVAFYLLHHEVRSILASTMEGATGRQRLPKDVLADFPVPLPPIQEQRDIGELLSQILKATEYQAAIASRFKSLKAATMAKLFHEGLRGEPLKASELGLIPESWDAIRLGTCCKMKSGGTPSRSIPEYWNGSIPWVKTTEVDYREIKETEEFITEKGLAESSARLFPAGTVLMAMYGQGVTRGRVALLGIPATTNQACAAFFPDETISAHFLYAYFTHAYEDVRRLGHGANQQNLSLELLEQIWIPRPRDKEEQEEIFNVINSLQRRTQVAEEEVRALEQLFAATLHQLITGEVRLKDIDIPVVQHA